MEKPERFCRKRAIEEERRGRGSRRGRGRASRGASSPSVRQRTTVGHSGPRGGTLPSGTRPREAADGLLLAGRTRPGPAGSFRAEVSEAGPGHAKARPAGADHLKRINNKTGLVLAALMLRSLRRAWLASIFFLGASARFRILSRDTPCRSRRRAGEGRGQGAVETHWSREVRGLRAAAACLAAGAVGWTFPWGRNAGLQRIRKEDGWAAEDRGEFPGPDLRRRAIFQCRGHLGLLGAAGG